MEQEGANSTLVPLLTGISITSPTGSGIYATALNSIGEAFDAIGCKPDGSIVQDAQKRFGKIVA
jgi:hypothetical protein